VSSKQRGLIGSNLRRLVYAAPEQSWENCPWEKSTWRACAGCWPRFTSRPIISSQEEADPQVLEELYGQVQYVSGELGSLLLDKQQEFPWVSWQEYFAAKATVPQLLQAFTAINAGLGELDASWAERVPLTRGEITGESIEPEQAVEAARSFLPSGWAPLSGDRRVQGADPQPTRWRPRMSGAACCGGFPKGRPGALDDGLGGG